MSTNDAKNSETSPIIAAPRPIVTPEMLLGQRCFGGLDLSSVGDITAFDLYFPDFYALLCWFWVPQETAARRKEYQIWEKQGHIEISQGRTIDYDHIRRRISGWYLDSGVVKHDPACLSDLYDIKAIGYDPYNAPQICPKLADDDGLNMIEFRQGFLSMNAASKEFERLVNAELLHHFNNPVLTWMAANCEVVEKDGNKKPVKPSATSPLKIDGIVCAVMAVGLSMTQPGDDAKSGSLNRPEIRSVIDEFYS